MAFNDDRHLLGLSLIGEGMRLTMCTLFPSLTVTSASSCAANLRAVHSIHGYVDNLALHSSDKDVSLEEPLVISL